MSIWIWRLVAAFLFVNTGVCGQDYQYHKEEYLYQHQPLQQYGGYETHRQYRSAGNEPTTITPSSETTKDVLSMNQTLDSDLSNNSTHTSTRDINDMFPSDLEFIDDADVVTLPDGSITLVTDMPVENTSMASIVPSLMVDRDTSKSLLEASTDSSLSSMKQLNTTVEGMNSTLDNSTDEAIKILKRRQAPQVIIQQIPSQPQKVSLPVFQPLPIQRNQFIQAQQPAQQPALFFVGQPGQPAVVQLPIGQPRFVSDQVRFVPPQVLVPQQMVPLPKSQASETQPPVQSLKALPKLSLNPVPLPPSISPSHPNMTIPGSVNVSQLNAVKAREANANKVMPKVQPPMGTFKPMGSSVPPSHPTPPPAPVRAAITPPTTMNPSLQRPGMMPIPAQPMVRPQLQGQQVSLQSQTGVVEQNTTPLPRGLSVGPAPLLATQGQPPMVLKSSPTSMQAMPPLPPQINQQLGSPMDQRQPQQQTPPMGQVPPAQMSQQSVQPMGQPMNQPPPAAQRAGPLVNQPSQPNPMDQASLPQVAQRSGSPMDHPQQPMPVGQSMNQPHPDAQRSGPPMNQPSPIQPIGQTMNQATPTQVTQRTGPQAMGQLQQSMGQPLGQSMQQALPMSQPTGQAPLAQLGQRPVPPTDQSQQTMSVGQQMNQLSAASQRSGPINQPSPPQPASQSTSQPSQPQVPQRSGSPQTQSIPTGQPMSQLTPDAQRTGPPINQPSQPQPMGQQTGQASLVQMGQRSGLPPVNQPLPPQPPTPPSSQQLDQSFGSPPTPPQFSLRTSSQNNQPVPSPMMDFNSQPVGGVSLPISQLDQRSVHDGRAGFDRGNSAGNERHFMRRSVDGHHMMRRQMDAVPYPSKEAYDSYVVNNYHNQYDEIYPTYSLPVYTSASLPAYIATTAAAPKFEYYVSHY